MKPILAILIVAFFLFGCNSENKKEQVMNDVVNLDSLIDANANDALFLDFYSGMDKSTFNKIEDLLIKEGTLIRGNSLRLQGEIDQTGHIPFINESATNYQLIYDENGNGVWLEVIPNFLK